MLRDNKSKLWFVAVTAIVACLVVYNVCTAAQLYVPAQYDVIQAAVDDANDGDTIIVADGTYTGIGNYEIDPNGLEVTIKSENGPNNCTINCLNQRSAFLFFDGEDANTIIDGFTITNAFADDVGGAIFCGFNSNPVIKNCVITNSETTEYGGAIACYISSPTIDNCIITGSYARTFGGAIACVQGSPTINNCIITGNSAGESGGAILLDSQSNAVISRCTISSNLCGVGGGGIAIAASSPIIENCLITNNEGLYSGAAICYNGGTISLVNCTIANNFASDPNGTGGISCVYANPAITNTILWDNYGGDGSQIRRWDGNEIVTVSYSDIELADSSVWDGIGNINADPLFAAPELGDYHLKSTAGRWTDMVKTNGDLNDDGLVDWLDLEVFTQYWLQSSLADINNDKWVDFADYAILADNWLGTNGDADISNDGLVDRLDLEILAHHWLQASLTVAEIADLNSDRLVDFADYAILTGNWLKPGRYIGGWTYTDTETSPCIDAGDPSSDYTLEPEPNGDRINMGAYGNTPQASKSPLE